jgi:hypothetical protein
MITHTCTPYCEGQKLCSDRGTHTILWATSYESVEECAKRVEELYPSVELVKIRGQDVKAPAGTWLEVTGRLERRPYRENKHFWLVTVRERPA